MAGMEILYLGLTAGVVYLAWQTGLLDKAGEEIVKATTPKTQGWAEREHHRHRRREEILIPEVVIPVPVKRMRLTGIT